MKPFVAKSLDFGSSEVRAYRTRDEAKTLAALEAASPPFSHEVVAELVALAFAYPSSLANPLGAAIRKRARRLLEREVPDAKALVAAFKGVPAHASQLLDERVRRLDSQAVSVAKAIAFHRWAALSVPFERDAAFRVAVLEVALEQAKREGKDTVLLGEVYTEWRRSGGGSATTTDFHVVPDELADELGALRRRFDFSGVSFHGGSLTDLPAGFGRAKGWLKRLDLTYNPLQKLPAAVLQLANLEHLGLMGTELRELPTGLARLRKLRELDLRDARQLTELPEVVCDLPALEELWVSGKIKVLPAAIGRLKSLKVLSLISSGISRLPPEVATLPNLRRVEARFSRLHIGKAQAVVPEGCTIVT